MDEEKSSVFGGSNVFDFTQRLAGRVVDGDGGEQKKKVKKLAKDVVKTVKGEELDDEEEVA